MNYFVQINHLKPGDKLISPKSQWGIVKHHALYIGFDNSGTHWIIHNDFNNGVTAITLDAFLSQVPNIISIDRFHGTNEERKLLVERAIEKINKPYDLINYNCEHFANEIRTGKARSPQIQGVGIAIIGAMLLISFWPGKY